MKKSAILAGLAAVLVVAGALGFSAVRASGGGTSVKAVVELQSTSLDPAASGKAKSEQRPDRTRFAVEVEDVSTGGTHTARITRSGAAIANSPVTFQVDALGFGEIELNTQDGALNVPVALAGDLVEILNPANAVILSGTLAPK